MGDVREVLWWIRRVTIEAENVEKSIIKFGEWMGIWRFVWIPFKCHCWRNQWKRRKYFSCFAPLLLREIQIFKFLAPAKKKKCSRPGEKKKEPETCRLLLISRERESRVSVLRLFFFFLHGGWREVILCFFWCRLFFFGGRGLLSRSLSFHERLPAHRNVFK